MGALCLQIIQNKVLISEVAITSSHARPSMALIDRVAHRLKMRDLRLLDTVVRWGSMAKASDQLHLSQPAVSKAVAEMEHLLGVRLIERGRMGVEPTLHGRALLKR